MKIYFPYNLYSSKFRGQLFPLLKPFIKSEGFTDQERLAMYHISDKDFSLTDTFKNADIIVLPMSWNYYHQQNQTQNALQFVNEMKSLNKKVYSFTTGDFGVKIPELTNLIVLRQSGDRSKLPNHHIGMPSFIVDPLKKQFKTEEVYYNETSIKPSIGFCGQTNSSVQNTLKEIFRTNFRNLKYYFRLSKELPQKTQSTSKLRSKVLEAIKESNLLEDNFIERNKYRAGASTSQLREKTTQEFYNNIKETDYTVCVRGAGNFSVRFYETLAMGRIPIFINTDCILPLADKIDWKKHVVWLEENEISKIEEKVIEFHQQFTFKEIKDIQKSNRKLWEEQLTLGGFFKQILIDF